MILVSETRYFDYRQVCVYVCGLDNPYNHWSPEEYSQGFAYRKKSVSFITTWQSNDYQVSVELDETKIDPSASIVIKVPFFVDLDEGICISSVMDSAGDELRVTIPSGKYSLRYEAFPPSGEQEFDEVQKMRIVFNRDDDAKFEIIRANDLIKVPLKFFTTGRPA